MCFKICDCNVIGDEFHYFLYAVKTHFFNEGNLS